MSETVRIIELSSSNLNALELSSVQFVFVDQSDTTQNASGSTKKTSGEDLANKIWSLSSDYIEKSKWDSTYNSVNSNSAINWNTDFLSGGTVNQIFTKDSSTDKNGSWKNKRTSLTLSTLTSTGTIASNALSADQFVVSVSGASTTATIGAPSNPYDAQIIMWNIRYSSNIAKTDIDTSFRIPITTLNWSNSANRMDIFTAKYNSLDSKWDVIGFSPGYLI